MWKTEDPSNPIGTLLARAQDVPERLLHHQMVSGILDWSDLVVTIQGSLCAHYTPGETK